MEYPDHLIITIRSEEDNENFVRDYREFLLEKRDEYIETSSKGMDYEFITDLEELKNDDEEYLKRRVKTFNEMFEKYQQYAFILNKGTVLAAVDNDGKLIATTG